MEISIKIPADASGFIRRECPTCEQEFKWFHGHTADRPDDFTDPEVYFCPYCGVTSGTDTWWTPAQLEYARDVAIIPMAIHIEDELRDTLKPLSKYGMKVEVSSPSYSEPPAPLIDPDDMVIIEPPCHTFEPIKIKDDWQNIIYCLMCGLKFRI